MLLPCPTLYIIQVQVIYMLFINKFNFHDKMSTQAMIQLKQQDIAIRYSTVLILRWFLLEAYHILGLFGQKKNISNFRTYFYNFFKYKFLEGVLYSLYSKKNRIRAYLRKK